MANFERMLAAGKDGALLRYSLGVYNLLDWRYGMPVGAEYPDLEQEIPQAGRAFLARLSASF